MRKGLCIAVVLILASSGEAFSFDFLEKAREVLQETGPEAGREKGKAVVSPLPGGSYRARGGFTVNLPAGWKVGQDEERNFRLDKASRPGVQVAVVVNDYGPDFPVGASRKAYLDGARREKESGAIERMEEVSLGAATGVLRVERPPADPEDARRITFQGYAGSVGINVIASSRGREFARERGDLMALVRSLRW